MIKSATGKSLAGMVGCKNSGYSEGFLFTRHVKAVNVESVTQQIEIQVQLNINESLSINNEQDASSIQNFYLQRPHNLHETYQLPRVQLITHDGHSRY
jgi:hypothetical protein